jgi:hypothetical protein
LVNRSGNVGQQLRPNHFGPFLIVLTELWKEDCKCYGSFSQSDLKRIEETASCAISIDSSFLTIRDRYFTGTGFYSKKSSFGRREVTLIEIESVEALFRGVLNAEGERLGISLTAADTRRNIATSGVPLNHLVDREFHVGAVLMRGMRLCEPCKHLEDLTQHGVVSGLIHRGGLRAQILTEGLIRVGDAIHS